MKKFLSLFIILLLCFMVGCAGANNDAVDGGGYGPSISDGGIHYWSSKSERGEYGLDGVGGEAIGAPSGEGEEETNTEEPEQVKLQAGQITASATFDNDKYTFWRSLLIKGQEEDGIFKSYNDNYAFKTSTRIVLTFPQGLYAKVNLIEDEKVVFTGIADPTGKCYIFSPKEKETYQLEIEYLGENNTLVKMNDEVSGDKEYDLKEFTTTLYKDSIELMVIVDATGSMGDEMRYLQAELTDVIKKVKKANANITVKLSAMVYRDDGDEYVVRCEDFTEDIATQISFLSNQEANGGGDFEEAVQEAYIEALKCSWSEFSPKNAKIVIHVADAPSHDKDIASWNDSILKLASMGARIITVASSGIDKKTEYLFRCQSLLTNGVYVHITNDSGIGGSHIEATTEEPEEVELLNDCLVRLINGMLTGEFSAPINWRQSQSVPAE